MKPKTTKRRAATYSAVAAGIMAAGLATPVHAADSTDALLRKLVDKGILTAKEADDLQHDNKDSAKTTVVAGLGMPDWVTSLKFYGDFRGRIEENLAESEEYHERVRYRYRVRLGLNINTVQNFEVGVRLSTGNPQTNPGGTLVGGSPITANQDMNSFESRKFVWIDAAYAKWSPIKNDAWTVTGMIGKFDNPFLLSNMIFDYDLVPEGAGLQAAYKINDAHTIKAIGGVFVLDELNQGFNSPNKLPAGVKGNPAHDPYILGGQVLLESKWTPQFETTLGLAVLSIDSRDSLNSLAQPFYNSGNSRDTNGFLVNNYNPIIGSAAATYKFGAIPIYPGKDFPVKVAGEYMDNVAAEHRSVGWRAGVTVGKAAKRNTWEINYRYQRLEGDAWFDALVDDDNGAFYSTGNTRLQGTGKSNGWFGGTNVKGHQVVATYQLTDFLNFSFIYYNNQLVDGKDSSAQHFMADLNWKF